VTLWNTGHESDAEKRLRRAEELMLSLPSEQRNVGGNFDLLLSQIDVNCSGMPNVSGQFDKAITRADAGLSRLEPHLKIEPNDVQVRDTCLQLHGNRGYARLGLRQHREAAGDWTRVVELSARPVPAEYRVRLAIELMFAGDRGGALTQAQLLKPAADIAQDDCYNIGCIFARSAEDTQKDNQLPAGERAELVESHVTDAIRWLKSSADAGIFADRDGRDQAMTYPDLAILRDKEKFRQLVEPPHAKP
jgi:hypothetical protein